MKISDALKVIKAEKEFKRTPIGRPITDLAVSSLEAAMEDETSPDSIPRTRGGHGGKHRVDERFKKRQNGVCLSSSSVRVSEAHVRMGQSAQRGSDFPSCKNHGATSTTFTL